MAKLPKILLLLEDSQRRDRRLAELAGAAHVSISLQTSDTGTIQPPELIVTDSLPLAHLSHEIADQVSCGEIAVIRIGVDGPGDVVLPRDCTGRELRLASQLTAEIVRLRRSLAIERRSRQALRKMAYTDPLTGLANRRKWDQELVSRMDELKDAGSNVVLGIALLDLDLFKSLNDRLGHTVGDTALRHIGQKLTANLSQQHLAARLGGDEFGILLSGVRAHDVPQVIDLIRRTLEYQPEKVAGDVPPLTTSAGVVVVASSDTVRPIDALQSASQALRSAKQQGRNRTVVNSLGKQ